MASHKSTQLYVQNITFYVSDNNGQAPAALPDPIPISWTEWKEPKKDTFTYFSANISANVAKGYPIDIYVSAEIIGDADMKKDLLEGDHGFYGWGHTDLKNVKGVTNWNDLRFLSDYQDLSKFLGQKPKTFSVYFWLPTKEADTRPILLVFMPAKAWIDASRFSKVGQKDPFPSDSMKELSATIVEELVDPLLIMQLSGRGA